MHSWLRNSRRRLDYERRARQTIQIPPKCGDDLNVSGKCPTAPGASQSFYVVVYSRFQFKSKIGLLLLQGRFFVPYVH